MLETADHTSGQCSTLIAETHISRPGIFRLEAVECVDGGLRHGFEGGLTNIGIH